MTLAPINFDDHHNRISRKLEEMNALLADLNAKQQELERDTQTALDFSRQRSTNNLNQFFASFRKYQLTAGKNRGYHAPTRELIGIYMLGTIGVDYRTIARELNKLNGNVKQNLEIMRDEFGWTEEVNGMWYLTESGRERAKGWKEDRDGQQTA